MFGGALAYYSLSVWCYVKLFACWLLSLDALVCSLFVKLNFLITANLINHVVQTNKQKKNICKKHIETMLWWFSSPTDGGWEILHTLLGLFWLFWLQKVGQNSLFFCSVLLGHRAVLRALVACVQCVTVLSLLLWRCWRGRFFADQSFCLSLVMDIYLLDTLGKHLVLWVALIYHRETWHVRKTVGVVQ